MDDAHNESAKAESIRAAGQEASEAGKFDEAAAAYERLVKLFPEDANLWRDLGLCYKVIAQHEKAVDAFNRAVSLQPAFAQAWDMLGMQFWDAFQFALAAAAFEKAVQVDPKYTHSWAGLVQMYALLHRADDAWDAWCKLRDLDAKYAKEIEFTVREYLEYDMLTNEDLKRLGIDYT